MDSQLRGSTTTASIPETTSAEAFARYVGGKLLRVGEGKAWREIKVWTMSLPRRVEALSLPSVSEPFIAWTTSGAADLQEREGKGPWMTHRLTKGSFFLTTGGAPYEVRWRAVTAAPFETMAVFLEIPLMERALDEAFGADAAYARLRDASAFTDGTLNTWMEQLHGELMRRKASALFVQGIAQSIAAYLARNYTYLVKDPRIGSPSLPGYKLRQITDWMAENVAENFNLDRLAAKVGLSKFYFDRLFKRAVGVSPSHYHIDLRVDAAKRLLRETKKTVIEIGFDVGYTNPSHFAQIFRRATGVTPSEYRKQR